MNVQITLPIEINFEALGLTPEKVAYELNRLLRDNTTVDTDKFLSGASGLLRNSIQHALEKTKRKQNPMGIYEYVRADGHPGEAPKWYVETLLLMKHVFITFKNVTAKII